MVFVTPSWKTKSMYNSQHHLKKTNFKRKKKLVYSLLLGSVKILISVGLLIWLFSTDIAFLETLSRLKGIHIGMLLLAGLPIAISYPLISWRWQYILNALGYDIGFREAISISWIGSFFNHTLPTNMAGELVRVWAIYRRESSLEGAISSVILDRIIALLALAAFIIVTLPLTHSIMGYDLAWTALAISSAIILMSIAGLLVSDVLVGVFRNYIYSKIMHMIDALSRDMRKVLVKSSVILLFFSVVSFIAQAFSFWALALGLGVSINLADAIILIPPIFLITTLPISFAGWGLRELAVVTALSFVNVPEEQSIVISLSYGFLTLAMAVPGGFIWLLTKISRQNHS